MRSYSSLLSTLFFHHFTCLVLGSLLVVHSAFPSATSVLPQANESFSTSPTSTERLSPPPLSLSSLPHSHLSPQQQLIQQPQQQHHKPDPIRQESVPGLQYQHSQIQPLLPNTIKDDDSN